MDNSDNGELKISLDIAREKLYPITVKREDEQIYREAAKKVNTLFAKYENTIKETKTKLLAICALQFSLEVLEKQKNEKTNSIFVEEIKELDKEISDYLKEEEQ